MPVEILGAVETSIHAIHVPIQHVARSIGRRIRVSQCEFRRSLTWLQLGIRGLISFPDPDTDFSEVPSHPLTAVTNLEEGMQKTADDRDGGDEAHPIGMSVFSCFDLACLRLYAYATFMHKSLSHV